MSVSDCTDIGDSIAVGLAQALHCRPFAKIGRSSGTQAAVMQQVSAHLAIISLGSNDPMNRNLPLNLLRVRSQVDAGKVVWIAPRNRHAAAAVRQIATRMGDRIVWLSDFSSHDGVHPASYQRVGRSVTQGASI